MLNSRKQLKTQYKVLEAVFYYNLFKVYGEHNIQLYYERRTNQYNKLSISKYKIISIETQIKTFAAMFLNQPHMTSGFYGKIAKMMRDKIFNANHESVIYYTSGLAMWLMMILRDFSTM